MSTIGDITQVALVIFTHSNKISPLVEMIGNTQGLK